MLTNLEGCMMSIQYRKTEENFTFLTQQGEEISRKTEIRFDPITNETSRIIFNPGFTPESQDFAELAIETSGKKCPFCEENILQMTPVFSQNINESGRFIKGESTVFPNLFPYSKHNGVAVMTKKHYIKLHEFTQELLFDAFTNAFQYIQKVALQDEQATVASINWNYLPQSGGSILHPHLHIIVTEYPTNAQTIILNKLDLNPSIYHQLYLSEKEQKKRYIGEDGNVAWLSAYAPKSHHDYLGLFHQGKPISVPTENDWQDFASGLLRIFKNLTGEGFTSFNFSLQIPLKQKQPMIARLIPRVTMGKLATSDMNFFQMMHNEPLSYFSPESIAEKAKAHF